MEGVQTTEKNELPQLELESQVQKRADDLKELTKILSANMQASKLSPEYFEYLANIIYEDPPRNVSDVVFFIKDYLENVSEVSSLQTQEVSKKIFQESESILKDSTSHWVASQLSQPIQIEKVQMITFEEEDAGYKETPYSIELIKIQNKIMDSAQDISNNKKMLRDQQKRKQDLQRRLMEMKQMENRLPPIQVLHEREGNYSLDIKVDNFTLEVSGKVLIENGSLLLSSGRKYGLIGHNGIGKTTLLYSLAKKEVEGMNQKP